VSSGESRATRGSRARRAPVAHERRVQLVALAGGAPALVLALALLWRTSLAEDLRWLVAVLLVGTWLLMGAFVRIWVAHPLQTLANMLGALRVGDYSLRARAANPDDALGLALHEVNLLGTMLREQRLGALEAGALLRRVMAEIDVGVFAFDGEGRLVLVNPEGQRLLGAPAERLIGRAAGELGLDAVRDATAGRLVDVAFPGARGRFDVRRGEFRQGGRPHQLLLVADLSATLGAEERLAWQRLVRVLSHEINNSLAPIKSIAGSLQRRLASGAAGAAAAGAANGGTLVVAAPTDDGFARGLQVIAERAESLSRFIGAYARLTRLPPPQPRLVAIGELVRRASAVETRVAVRVDEGPPIAMSVDADQMSQLLINLVRNAADAALETHGGVTVRWELAPGEVRLIVEDEGPGIAESANLFVPFYSTKPEGSGIGLALSRQIASQHGGSIVLENRGDRRGARAVVTLPR
jgi:nitrogen fixation/metabolism regulation signal transduction histidine kinase